MTEIVITGKDHGKTIKARQDDRIVFQVQENLSTGYRWEVEGTERKPVEFIDSTYTESPGSVMGGGGMRVVRFVARSVGTQEIHMYCAGHGSHQIKPQNDLM